MKEKTYLPWSIDFVTSLVLQSYPVRLGVSRKNPFLSTTTAEGRIVIIMAYTNPPRKWSHQIPSQTKGTNLSSRWFSELPSRDTVGPMSPHSLEGKWFSFVDNPGRWNMNACGMPSGMPCSCCWKKIKKAEFFLGRNMEVENASSSSCNYYSKIHKCI